MGTGEFGIWIVNLGYLGANAPIPANAESAIANSWATQCAAAFRSVITSDAGLFAVKVTCVSNIQRIPFQNVTNTALGNGTATGNPLPSVNAVVVSKQTGTKGQHGRGRNYMPSVPGAFVNNAVDPDRITTGSVGLYQSSINTWFSAAITDGTNPVTLAIFTRVTKGAAVTNAANVLTYIIRPLLGTVRRRRIGRGK